MTMASGLFLEQPGRIELRRFEVRSPSPGEAIVRVAGCGLCHTDVTFYSGAVKTRHGLPIVLGHEIAGTVAFAPPPFDHLLGQNVIVPSVIPCDRCELCQAGRDNACLAQVMPGNDVNGGFATHVVVPAGHLVTLPDDLGSHSLAELAVIADAVTTPYQALHRADVQQGDLVIIVGVGGIGTYAAQIGLALGAAVAAIDIDEEKLKRLDGFGVAWRFNPHITDAKAIKKTLAGEAGVSTARWRILEMSGTTAGQELAWSLLPPAGTLGVIGFTPDRVTIHLSRLMACDATAFGSWGCSPRLYPAALELVLSGRVRIKPFVDVQPLASGPALFARLASGHNGGHGGRPVLIPE